MCSIAVIEGYMPSAMDVANYFLATLGVDPESDLTNLKLQRLCAYAQALCLAHFDTPLYADEIEAWDCGPIIPLLNYEFAKYGNLPITPNGLSEKYAIKSFNEYELEILKMVLEHFGSLSAWYLRERSYVDFPGYFGSKKIISKISIKNNFLRLIPSNK